MKTIDKKELIDAREELDKVRLKLTYFYTHGVYSLASILAHVERAIQEIDSLMEIM